MSCIQLNLVWWMCFSVCVFTLRWSTRLAVEAGSSLSATWTNWTAPWSPLSMEVAPVYHRLPWTWSLSFTSHTPSNTCKTATHFKPTKQKVAQIEELLFVAGHAKATANFAQLDLQPLAQHSHSEVGDVDLYDVLAVFEGNVVLVCFVLTKAALIHYKEPNTKQGINNNMTKYNQTIKTVFLCSAFQTPCWNTSVNVSHRHHWNVSPLDVFNIF